MKVLAYMPTPGGLTGAPGRLLTLASVLRAQYIDMRIATQRDSDLFLAAENQRLGTVAAEPIGVLRQRHSALFGGNAVFRLQALASLLVQNLSIARKIRRDGADVVWIRSSKGIAFAGLGAILSRRPLVWDVDFELPSRGMVRWLHRMDLLAAKRVVFQYSSAPDAIFGPELAARYRHKFQTIIPGIDLPSLEPYWDERMAKRRREGEPFVILQVGTICDRKNQQLLIDALVQVRDECPNEPIRVQLVGGVFEEDYAEALKEKVNAAGLDGDVEFLGWRTDVHDLMVRADLLAMPSRDEGVPNTVQEAMAIGLPVLVSEAGGIPEIVTEGATGWVLELDRPGSWANRIVWCLRNREALAEVGARGAEYAGEQFGTAQWGVEYAQVIATCAGVAQVSGKASSTDSGR